eukprot:gene424-2429_t
MLPTHVIEQVTISVTNSEVVRAGGEKYVQYTISVKNLKNEILHQGQRRMGTIEDLRARLKGVSKGTTAKFPKFTSVYALWPYPLVPAQMPAASP